MMNKTVTHTPLQRRQSSPGTGVVRAALLLEPSHDWLFHGGFLLSRELWTDDHSQSIIHPPRSGTESFVRQSLFTKTEARTQIAESARISKCAQFGVLGMELYK